MRHQEAGLPLHIRCWLEELDTRLSRLEPKVSEIEAKLRQLCSLEMRLADLQSNEAHRLDMFEKMVREETRADMRLLLQRSCARETDGCEASQASKLNELRAHLTSRQREMEQDLQAKLAVAQERLDRLGAQVTGAMGKQHEQQRQFDELENAFASHRRTVERHCDISAGDSIRTVKAEVISEIVPDVVAEVIPKAVGQLKESCQEAEGHRKESMMRALQAISKIFDREGEFAQKFEVWSVKAREDVLERLDEFTRRASAEEHTVAITRQAGDAEKAARRALDVSSRCDKQLEELRQQLQALSEDTAQSLRSLSGELARMRSRALKQWMISESSTMDSKDNTVSDVITACRNSSAGCSSLAQLVDELDDCRQRIASHEKDVEVRFAESLQEIGRQLSRHAEEVDSAAGEAKAALDVQLVEQARRAEELDAAISGLQRRCAAAEADAASAARRIEAGEERFNAIVDAKIELGLGTRTCNSAVANLARCADASEACAKINKDTSCRFLSLEAKLQEAERRLEETAGEVKSLLTDGSTCDEVARIEADFLDLKGVADGFITSTSKSMKSLTAEVDRVVRCVDGHQGALDSLGAEVARLSRHDEEYQNVAENFLPRLREVHAALEEERLRGTEHQTALQNRIEGVTCSTTEELGRVQSCLHDAEQRLAQNIACLETAFHERLQDMVRVEVCAQSRDIQGLLRSHRQDLETRVESAIRALRASFGMSSSVMSEELPWTSKPGCVNSSRAMPSAGGRAGLQKPTCTSLYVRKELARSPSAPNL